MLNKAHVWYNKCLKYKLKAEHIYTPGRGDGVSIVFTLQSFISFITVQQSFLKQSIFHLTMLKDTNITLNDDAYGEQPPLIT
jgi:hypothetical protein